MPDGISQRCNQQEVFALHIRMLPALACLPAGNVIEGFEELVYGLLQYFRTPTSVDIIVMHQDVLCFLLLTFGTCLTELMMNYHAPTIA